MAGPESTAARVALWRALHVEVDGSPHVFDDTLGLRLVAPDEGWRGRGDMHPRGTAPFRASIVGRARFVEDFLESAVAKGVTQYVILGAGIDTLVQRRPELAAKLRVFEIEQPEPQAWKKARLAELGLPAPISCPSISKPARAGSSSSRKPVSIRSCPPSSRRPACRCT